MKIWHHSAPSIEQINQMCANTMISELEILIDRFEKDTVVATMPIKNKVMQPYGIMHGGASCVLAETVGSVAAHCCVDSSKFFTVGQNIETSHIRPISRGIATAFAKPVHIGSRSHIWMIEVKDEFGKLISITKLTMAVVDKEKF